MKEKDNFKPFDVTKFDSGWMRKRLIVSVTCGDNRHMMTIESGSWEDGHGDVYTYTKPGKDDDGNNIKGQGIKIPFKDRLTDPRIEEVAEFRKFIIDTEVSGRREALENAINSIKDGKSLTDEELAKCGVNDPSELDGALEKSKKKRHGFISEYDFIDHVKKVIDSGKYKDSNFYIYGQMHSTYSDEKGRFYDNFVPQKIELVGEDREPYSVGTITNFLFGSESIDEGSVDEKGRIYINGWEMVRDNNRKANIPHPVTIAIDSEMKNDKGTNIANAFKRKFKAEGDEIKEYGVRFNMLNGAQRKEISLDDLDEEIREDIELGLVTLEQVQRELGGSVYGDRVQENVFIGPAKGWASKLPETTAFTIDDMVVKPIDNGVDEDLFDDDDEI